MKSSSGKFYPISVTHIISLCKALARSLKSNPWKIRQKIAFSSFGQFKPTVFCQGWRACNQKLLADFYKLQFLKSLDCIFKQNVILKGFVSVLLFKHILWHDSLLDIFWGVLKDCNESLSACQNNLLFVV